MVERCEFATNDDRRLSLIQATKISDLWCN